MECRNLGAVGGGVLVYVRVGFGFWGGSREEREEREGGEGSGG